jgi:dihydrofolate synthase / folylpolyglutamate synthase
VSAPSSDVLLERLMGLHPKLIDLSLDRMIRILAALGHPERALPPVVHIAGTNGKGSTVATMKAALIAAGYRVHAYTSPHLVRFHERVELDGEIIAEPALAALLEECERANGGVPITFFEITTAAAFLGFSRTPADILLMETGLGGRLDATNMIEKPLVTIITPVSLDHQQFLGDTVGEIAGEKAGILKPGVLGVIGPQPSQALEAIERRAAAIAAPLLVAGRDFVVESVGPDGFVLRDGDSTSTFPLPVLPGAHQPFNAASAIVALRRLAGFTVDDAAIATGLKTARWPARLQKLETGALKDRAGPKVELWLDGGHNPSAGEVLADMARTWGDRPLDLIVGMMNTKDPVGFVRPLAPLVRRARAVSIPGEKNTLPAEETLKVLRQAGVEAAESASVGDALDELNAAGNGPARVLICGSLYLAGRVLEENG